MFTTLAALLGATVLAVPLTKRAGLGAILGYLVAGIAIGPHALGLVSDVGQIAGISELGVIMLLFLIGLELRPHRLWILRKSLIQLGAGQFFLTAALLSVLIESVAGIGWPGAVTLGAGLALSSTAIALPLLAERDLLPSAGGRDAFATLLFQDVAFIPLVAVVPLLAHPPDPAQAAVPWLALGKGVAVIAAILAIGRYALPPALRFVARVNSQEVFSAAALLAVTGAAALASAGGLSPSLGAFLAGSLLSDSEYAHELKADIEPFEGLLLGFFFLSVGMGANLTLAAAHPGLLAGGLAALLAGKIVPAFGVAFAKRRNVVQALRFAVVLGQGSEFSFVLLGAAVAEGALSQEVADFATVTVAASMLAAPLLFAASERAGRALPGKRRAAVPREADAVEEQAPVIVAGFGRMGQVVGRILSMQRIAYVALDRDPGQIEVVRRFGNRIYYGDATRLDVLRAAGAERARVLVLAIDDMDASLRIAEMARRHFRQLRIYARARNRRHAQKLMDVGMDGVVRETFFSGLKLAEAVLEAEGVPEARAQRAIDLFARHDAETLQAQRAIADDEAQLIQSAQQAAAELESLFEADREMGDEEKSS